MRVPMWSLLISVLFGGFGIICLKIAYQHKRNKLPAENVINDTAMGLIFILCAFTFPFMYVTRGTTERWQNTFFIITAILIYGFIMFLFYYVITDYLRAKKNPELKISRGYKRFLEIRREAFESDPKMKVKMDTNRKYLHLIPVGVILGSFLISALIDAIGILPSDLDIISLGMFLIVLIGYAFCAMFMMAEILRLVDNHNRFHLAPDWAHKWFKSSIKDSEVASFISSIPIVLCLMPFVFAPIPIFIAVGNVACLSDAAASVFGKRFGKREIKLNPPKTYAGLIAGGMVTFFCVFIPMVALPTPPINLNLWVISLMSLGTSGVFIIIDVFAKHIGDNFLNPLMCGAFMVLFYSLI